jgi:hypothetical protein
MRLTGLTGFGGRRRAAGGGTVVSTVGIDSVLGSQASIGNNRACQLRIVMPEAGTINSIWAYLRGGNSGVSTNMKASLYTSVDTAGSTYLPDEVISSSVSDIVVVPQEEDGFDWHEFELGTPYSASNAEALYLTFHCSSNIDFKYQLSVWSGYWFQYNNQLTFSTPEDSDPSSDGNRYEDGGLSIYATYT